ncbi:hypothetical protein LguiB_001278 [Lonicera macranthoides]
MGTFVGAKSFPLRSVYGQKLLDLSLNLHWPAYRVTQACQAFGVVKIVISYDKLMKTSILS